MIEILAKKATAEGSLAFRKAGSELYLIESVGPEFLVCPLVKQQHEHERTSDKKDKKPIKHSAPPSPGSFTMDIRHFQENAPGSDKKAKGKRGANWKREARKERNKRSV